MSEWQGIESAPKDGTRVLLSDEDGDAHVARWLMKLDAPEISIQGDERYGGWVIWCSDDGPHSIVLPSATHWQPLPDPPDAQALAKAGEMGV